MKSKEWVLIQHDWCPYKKRRLDSGTDRGEAHMRTQREGGHLPAPERVLRRNQPCRHFHLRLLASSIVRKFCCLSHPVWDNLFWRTLKNDCWGLFQSRELHRTWFTIEEQPSLFHKSWLPSHWKFLQPSFLRKIWSCFPRICQCLSFSFDLLIFPRCCLWRGGMLTFVKKRWTS